MYGTQPRPVGGNWIPKRHAAIASILSIYTRKLANIQVYYILFNREMPAIGFGGFDDQGDDLQVYIDDSTLYINII